MNNPYSSHQWKRNGFTLIELLVTMAISSVLLITLSAVIIQTTDSYALSQRAVNHLSQARAFFQLIESELSTRLPETPLIHRSSITGASLESDRIAFVRVLPNDEQNSEFPGDLAIICYYVAFVQEADQRVIPKLFRKILNSTETQEFLEAGESAEFPEVDPTLDEPVIDFVMSFRATPMYLNPETGNDEPWNKTIQLSPSHLELIIRTTDESLSRRLTDEEAWNRLTITPKKNDLQMIRTAAHRISIGK